MLSKYRTGFAIILLLLTNSGCSAFMAGYREPYVRNVRTGMASAGVANLAGEPQRRDTVATAAGPLEVWYYVVPACSGGFEERPVAFSDGSVIAVGRDALESLQAFFAAYSTGYEKGGEDRDTEWRGAIAAAAPEIQRQISNAEARAYAAGQRAGAQQTKEMFRKAWNEYLRTLQDDQARRFGL